MDPLDEYMTTLALELADAAPQATTEIAEVGSRGLDSSIPLPDGVSLSSATSVVDGHWALPVVVVTHLTGVISERANAGDGIGSEPTLAFDVRELLLRDPLLFLRKHWLLFGSRLCCVCCFTVSITPHSTSHSF